jgi:hypothetical protein
MWCVCVYAWANVCVFLNACMCMYACTSRVYNGTCYVLSINAFVHSLCMFVCMHACMHVCMYVRMYVCMHVYALMGHRYLCVTCAYVCIMYVCIASHVCNVRMHTRTGRQCIHARMYLQTFWFTCIHRCASTHASHHPAHVSSHHQAHVLSHHQAHVSAIGAHLETISQA